MWGRGLTLLGANAVRPWGEEEGRDGGWGLWEGRSTGTVGGNKNFAVFVAFFAVAMYNGPIIERGVSYEKTV